MINSMTGFARREASGPWGQLACELRSVNHRYLEPGFRLPEELRGLEGELRQTLAKLLRRGKVGARALHEYFGWELPLAQRLAERLRAEIAAEAQAA